MKVLEINSFEDLMDTLFKLVKGQADHNAQGTSEPREGLDKNNQDGQTLIDSLLASVEKDFVEKAKLRLDQLKLSLQKEINYLADSLESYCLGCNLKDYVKGVGSLDALLNCIDDGGAKVKIEKRLKAAMFLYSTIFNEDYTPKLKGHK